MIHPSKKKKKNPLNHDRDPPKEGRIGGEIQQPSYHETQTKSSHTTIYPKSTTKQTKIYCHKPTTTAKIHHHQTHKSLNPKPTLNTAKPTAWVNESEELKREWGSAASDGICTKSSHTTIDPQSTIKQTNIHCHKPTTTAKIHHHQTHKSLNPKPTLNTAKPRLGLARVRNWRESEGRQRVVEYVWVGELGWWGVEEDRWVGSVEWVVEIGELGRRKGWIGAGEAS